MRVVVTPKPDMLVAMRAACVDPEALVLHAPSRTMLRLGRRAVFGPTAFAVFEAIALRRGVTVPYRDLYDAVWGHDPDGGPLSPQNMVARLRCMYAARLAAIGIDIAARHGFGLELARLGERPQRLRKGVGPYSRLARARAA